MGAICRRAGDSEKDTGMTFKSLGRVIAMESLYQAMCELVACGALFGNPRSETSGAWLSPPSREIVCSDMSSWANAERI